MYLVWTKQEYEELWRRVEAPDLAAVEAVIRDNFGTPVEVQVTIPVEHEARVQVKIQAAAGPAGEPNAMARVEKRLKEVHAVETAQSEAVDDKGPGAKGHRKI